MLIEDRSGIYKITNLNNGKFYVGSAVNLRLRRNHHHSKLSRGIHENIILQRAWNKYNGLNFEFVVLEFCEKEDLIKREQHWMTELNSYDKKISYNICVIAASRLGVKATDETKRKISESQKNKGCSEERRLHLLSFASQPKSEETKAKISKTLTGRKHTPERLANITKANRARRDKDFVIDPSMVIYL